MKKFLMNRFHIILNQQKYCPIFLAAWEDMCESVQANEWDWERERERERDWERKWQKMTINKSMFKEKLHISVFPYSLTLSLGQDMTQGHFFKQSLTGLNSEFSFS